MVQTLELPNKQNNGETRKNPQLSKRVRVAPVPSVSHSALLCTAAAVSAAPAAPPLIALKLIKLRESKQERDVQAFIPSSEETAREPLGVLIFSVQSS